LTTLLQGNGSLDSGPFYHGTKADLKLGDLLEPSNSSNYGERKKANYVYLTATLDAAVWGAELAVGDVHGRIYRVEPTGTIEDDLNLTDKKFQGNPTRSYRTRQPLRVVGEVLDRGAWRLAGARRSPGGHYRLYHGSCVEQYPVTEGHARQASEHASRGRNRNQGIALWGVPVGRHLGLDCAAVVLATAFHGSLAPFTFLTPMVKNRRFDQGVGSQKLLKQIG